MQVLFKEYTSWWSQFFLDVTLMNKMATENRTIWLIDILSSKLGYLLNAFSNQESVESLYDDYDGAFILNTIFE